MAVYKALPDTFAKVHPRFKIPTVSTIAMGAISLLPYLGMNFASDGKSRSPQTTLKTPGGKHPAASSAIRIVVTGVVSLGLSTTVLPAAIAGPIFQTAITRTWRGCGRPTVRSEVR